MNVLIALVGALLLTADVEPGNDNDAWRDACHLSGYSCVWLVRPLVARAPLPELYGRYKMGDSYILVDENISGTLAYAVTVHEMVHYLQYKRGAWKFTKENSCEMEREAFAVSNVALTRLGDSKDLVDWAKAKAWYGCP